MAKHYIRDLNYLGMGSVGAYHNAELAIMLAEYHLMRCGGAEWLWECDGEVGPLATNPNHVPDGDMVAVDVASWTALGAPSAVLSKDTTEKFSGYRSLKVVSKSVGSGVQSSALSTMTNPTNLTTTSSHYIVGPVNGVMTLWQNTIGYRADSLGCRIIISDSQLNNGTFNVKRPTDGTFGRTIEYYNGAGSAETLGPWGLPPVTPTVKLERKYELVIWAKNDSGVAWDVKVDRGDGSFYTVGTIPSDGDFQAYHYEFYKLSTGSVYIQVVDPSWSVDHTIYINGMNVFRSFFEYLNTNIYGSDGGVSGADTFDTGSHVPVAENIDKHLIFWDDDNPDNTGCYKIIGLSGGDYQLDLRSGSMTLTTHMSGDIPWRIVDLDNARLYGWDLGLATKAWGGMGVGVESPHSSKWRAFFRLSTQAGYEGRERHIVTWAAPEDGDFNLSSGLFYDTSPSTLRRVGTIGFIRETGNQHYVGGTSGNGSSTDPSMRFFLMTDDDISFITHVAFNSGSGQHTPIFIGYTGADPDHPDEEEFLLMAPYGAPGSGTATIGFDDGSDNAGYSMTTFTPEGYGARAVLGTLGYGAAALAVITQSNSCPNPISGQEHIDPMLVVRDPYGTEGCGSEREITVGLYMARTNMTSLTTFDGNAKIYFSAGWVWDWNGATLVP